MTLKPMPVNWVGLYTLSKREVSRFITVYSQTIVAPVVTTLLFYAVFNLAFGGSGRGMDGIDYMAFLAPGLIMMGMVQNAFANTSSSITIAKVQGTISDILMAPLSAGEMLAGYVIGGVVRGMIVGVVSIITLSLLMDLSIVNPFAIFGFALLGTVMLSLLGILGGLWAQKFDHIAAVTNFVITPLTFLSGTFYSIDHLPEFWQMLAHANPFFYMIDGFRSGFIGVSDSSLVSGFFILLCVNVVLWALTYLVLKSGYRIKS